MQLIKNNNKAISIYLEIVYYINAKLEKIGTWKTKEKTFYEESINKNTKEI